MGSIKFIGSTFLYTIGRAGSMRILEGVQSFLTHSNIEVFLFIFLLVMGGFQLLDLIITELKSHMTC